MNRKMHAMYQSVLKVEKVCYNVKVRGSEAAIWISSDAIEKERDDDDEGFANYWIIEEKKKKKMTHSIQNVISFIIYNSSFFAAQK